MEKKINDGIFQNNILYTFVYVCINDSNNTATLISGAKVLKQTQKSV